MLESTVEALCQILTYQWHEVSEQQIFCALSFNEFLNIKPKCSLKMNRVQSSIPVYIKRNQKNDSVVKKRKHKDSQKQRQRKQYLWE